VRVPRASGAKVLQEKQVGSIPACWSTTDTVAAKAVKLFRESAGRRSEGAEEQAAEKKRERQPRPLSQRPPRRTV